MKPVSPPRSGFGKTLELLSCIVCRQSVTHTLSPLPQNITFDGAHGQRLEHPHFSVAVRARKGREAVIMVDKTE